MSLTQTDVNIWRLLVNESAAVKKSGTTTEMIVYVDLRIAYSTPRGCVELVWHWCQCYKPLWTLIVLTAKVWWRRLCRYGSPLCKTLIFDLNPHDTNDGVSKQFIFFFSLSLNMRGYMSDNAGFFTQTRHAKCQSYSDTACSDINIYLSPRYIPPFFSEKCS